MCCSATQPSALWVPYGIDQSRFRSPDLAASNALRDRHGSPLILFVGVLRYYKGVQYLLEAMQRVPARLIVVGDGPLRPELVALAARLEVADRVAFVGAVADDALAAYYHAADVFCLPACERSEAFGLVQVEAMASGLPVVSTELGTGTSYVNLDGVSGIVVPPKQPEALAGALNRLLRDDLLRGELASGALARADMFVADRMVRDIKAVYDTVCWHHTEPRTAAARVPAASAVGSTGACHTTGAAVRSWFKHVWVREYVCAPKSA